jgi:hypothetical protein
MRDGFGCCFAIGLLIVAGAAFGQTAAGNPGQAAAGKLAFVSATVKPSVRSDLTRTDKKQLWVSAECARRCVSGEVQQLATH